MPSKRAEPGRDPSWSGRHWRVRLTALALATVVLLGSTLIGVWSRGRADQSADLASRASDLSLALTRLDSVVVRQLTGVLTAPDPDGVSRALSTLRDAREAVRGELPADTHADVWPAEATVEGLAVRTSAGDTSVTPVQWDDAVDRLWTILGPAQAQLTTQAHADFDSAAETSLLLHAAATLLVVVLLGVAEAIVRRARRADAEQLRRREARFRSLTDNGADGIVLVDAVGRVSFANAAAVEHLGPRRVRIGSSVMDWVSGPDSDRVAGALADAVELPDAIHRIEVPIPVDQGTRRLEVRLSNRLPDPDVASLVLNVRDVTAQAAAYQQLRHQQRLTQDLLDSIPAAVFVRDVTGRFTLVNRGFEAIVGFSRSEIMGRVIADVLPSQWQALARKNDEDLRRTGDPSTSQVVLTHGAAMHVYHQSRFLLRDERGDGYGLGGILTDVTEQATRAAERSWFTTVIDVAGEAMLSIDPTTRIERWNLAAERLFGYASAEAIGASATMLWDAHPDVRQAALARVLAGETLLLPGLLARHKDGHHFYVDVTAAPLCDATGAPSGVALIMHPTGMEGMDPVTGLPRWGMLMDDPGTTVGMAGAVVVLGVHRLDLVNVTRGKVAGDAILSGVASALRSFVAELHGPELAVDGWPTPDPGPRRLVARLARGDGGRLVVVDPTTTTMTEALDLANRAIRAARVPLERGDMELTPVVSAGVSLIRSDLETAVNDAVTALRQAKESGGGHACGHDPERAADEAAEMAMLEDLRSACGTDQIQMHYQPIMNLRTGAVTGVEALMRWEHPGRGFVRPDVFIPLAERSGLIDDLGRFALVRAASQAVGWGKDLGAVSVSVNVSAHQVKRPDFADSVLHALEAAALPATRLVLELTETSVLETGEAGVGVVDQLEQLRGFGVRVALDDFGTGYASLTYLNHLPVDVLKIDRSFVVGMRAGDHQRTVISSMIALGRRLGLDIVAEGIEDADVADELAEEGVTHGQGYLWSRPVPDSDLPAVVTRLRDASQPSIDAPLNPAPASERATPRLSRSRRRRLVREGRSGGA